MRKSIGTIRFRCFLPFRLRCCNRHRRMSSLKDAGKIRAFPHGSREMFHIWQEENLQVGTKTKIIRNVLHHPANINRWPVKRESGGLWRMPGSGKEAGRQLRFSLQRGKGIRRKERYPQKRRALQAKNEFRNTDRIDIRRRMLFQVVYFLELFCRLHFILFHSVSLHVNEAR